MKGNLFLGMGRGSVGDVTFSRLNGQQVARARNRKPNNPRTQSQMRQRTIFMSAIKFYTRGVQNFFQFAFEDKKATETDYNAFMRHNSKSGIYMRKEDFDNVNVPAIGEFEVSHGSMPTANYECYISDNNHPVAQFNVNGVSSTTSTIGALSTAIKSQYGLQEGDIVTILVVSSGAQINEDGDYTTRGLMILDGDPVKWSMVQFIIDTNSTATLASIGLGVAQNLVTFEVATANGLDAAACAVVFSRKTANGLKVSTSMLSLNQAADAILGEGNYSATDPAWLETVLASWSAREEAILEGALAQP